MWPLLFVLAVNAFGNACGDHNPNDPSVPLCPANGSKLLPDNYPAMAVTLSDKKGGSPLVIDIVTKTLLAQGDKPPQFIMNVTGENFDRVKKAVAKLAGNDKAKRDKWLSALTLIDAEPVQWQQDFMQSYVGADGRPQIRELKHYRARGLHFPPVQEALQKECGIPAGPGIDSE